jgi:hypothetical protein
MHEGTIMNPMDPDFWLRQWAAFLRAPIASLSFLAIGLFTAWCIRGWLDRREIKGLKEQINTWDQRLKLAGDQEQAAIRARQSATEELATLKTQMENKVSLGTMTTTTANVETHILEIGRAQDQVRETLQPLRRKVGDVTFGYRPVWSKGDLPSTTVTRE